MNFEGIAENLKCCRSPDFNLIQQNNSIQIVGHCIHRFVNIDLIFFSKEELPDQ
jgi:hypothetical protein